MPKLLHQKSFPWDELKKLQQENPASAIFTSIDLSCFHEYSNNNDRLKYSSSETEETTLPELLTSVYDPTPIEKCMRNIKINLHKINLVI